MKLKSLFGMKWIFSIILVSKIIILLLKYIQNSVEEYPN